MTPNAHQQTSGIRAAERFLRDEGVQYRVVHHNPTYAALDEARVSWLPVEQTAKTVVLHDGNEVVVVALPASERLDLRKLRAVLGRRRSLQLASEDEIAAHFVDYEVGAIPPFGVEPVDAHVVDDHLLTYNRVLCSGGDHRHSLLVDTMDLVRAGHALVADVCAPREHG